MNRGRLALLVLTLILAEAELEIVPESIRDHAQVRAAARARDRRPARTLLDSSVHHEAMRGLDEGERRGRPDIVHYGLLLALDSALNQADELRVVVHARGDVRIAVHPDTRLMRNYPRFVGLMEKLFQVGAVPSNENPLLVMEPGWSLPRIIEHHATGPVVAFHEGAKPIEPGAFFAEKRAASPDLTVVLGSFPHGDFHVPPEKWAQDVVGLGGPPLSLWSVEMQVLVHWERAMGIFPRTAAPVAANRGGETAPRAG